MIRRAAPLIALLLTGCLPDGQGAATRGGAPSATRPTIVSLNPCSDAILAGMATPGQLLAISHYSQEPSSTSMDLAVARRLRATGGTLEEVLALRPDIVVAGSYVSPPLAQGMRDAGIRLVTYPMPATVAQSETQIRDLARIAGNIAYGEQLVGDIEHALKAAHQHRDQPPVQALVWEMGGIVAGNDTLIADLLAHSGFANAASARGLAQADYLPLERMLANPPRVIFTIGHAADEEDRLLRHPALARLAGVQRIPLDGSLHWCGGPTIPRALARLARLREGLAE
ncbi:helical backbone metal receptor [Novosphingobium colocasiae]|uniref:helical backbone metal receptor n=1 Tax=Novosphingobium colocasiae TaxID=1256513 RepID=UPI0035AEBE87